MSIENDFKSYREIPDGFPIVIDSRSDIVKNKDEEICELKAEIDRLTEDRDSWRRTAEKLQREKIQQAERIEVLEQPSDILKKVVDKNQQQIYAEETKKLEAENERLRQYGDYHNETRKTTLAAKRELEKLYRERGKELKQQAERIKELKKRIEALLNRPASIKRPKCETMKDDNGTTISDERS